MTVPSAPTTLSPVLILGGGIHGAAVARELVLNGVPVVLVDANDLAAGATSKSSRLIHGGLRYLEYGDVRLVRESLSERRRLLELAPQFVRPLRLFVPTAKRWSGLLRSFLGFFKLARTRIGRWLISRAERKAPRGYWPVRIGLWMYDLFSWGDGLTKSRGMGLGVRAEGQGTEGSRVSSDESRVPEQSGPGKSVVAHSPSHTRHPTLVTQHSSGSRHSSLDTRPLVDPTRYRWMAEYSDAQMEFPERCVFALLSEAEQIARERNVLFEVIPYARLEWDKGRGAEERRGLRAEGRGTENTRAELPLSVACPSALSPCPTPYPSALGPQPILPSLIVNVSGAWGDMTLREIDPATTPLFAGTKGSHFVTRHPALKRLLGANGVYAETTDRRLCFILPFDDAVLVGTTDERWTGPPEQAVASDEELEYLLSLVKTVFGLTLDRSDIESHYSGVRPLPRTTDSTNAAVTRDHHLALHRLHGIPLITLVGGKLTTFRAVGEQIADQVLKQLGMARQVSTRDRLIAGAEGFPHEQATATSLFQNWSGEYDTTLDEVQTLWKLYGTRTKSILAAVRSEPRQVVGDSPFTSRVVRWVIDHEWVTTLDDLIERRLMLIFLPNLTRATLRDLAHCLVAAGRLKAESVQAAIAATESRLRVHFGRELGGGGMTNVE